MKTLIYQLTYADGFKRLTEVKASISVGTLNKMFDAWKNMNIQANLIDVR